MAKNRRHDKQKDLQINPYLDEFGFFTSLYDLHKEELLDLDKNHQRLFVEATLKVYDKDLLNDTERIVAKDLELINEESSHTNGANIFSYIPKTVVFFTVLGAAMEVANAHSVPNAQGNSVGNSEKGWVRSGFKPYLYGDKANPTTTSTSSTTVIDKTSTPVKSSTSTVEKTTTSTSSTTGIDGTSTTAKNSTPTVEKTATNASSTTGIDDTTVHTADSTISTTDASIMLKDEDIANYSGVHEQDDPTSTPQNQSSSSNQGWMDTKPGQGIVGTLASVLGFGVMLKLIHHCWMKTHPEAQGIVNYFKNKCFSKPTEGLEQKDAMSCFPLSTVTAVVQEGHDNTVCIMGDDITDVNNLTNV
ncbi:hypothetical protein [Candidatus Tisiphia endosymbiont of Oplodontha viridula]|uniref:hypothetical protein n=1 Tax=Candidatus Tisiphia endosymbiont of Oplodontha viridula TaxID=3077925 RepID=UPI0035C8FA7F